MNILALLITRCHSVSHAIWTHKTGYIEKGGYVNGLKLEKVYRMIFVLPPLKVNRGESPY
jgi:hypothetical protein